MKTLVLETRLVYTERSKERVSFTAEVVLIPSDSTPATVVAEKAYVGIAESDVGYQEAHAINWLDVQLRKARIATLSFFNAAEPTA